MPQQSPPMLTNLADGEWHRLHPLSAVSAIVATVIAAFWMMIFALPFLFDQSESGSDTRLVAALIIGGILVVFGLIGLFSWLNVRAHKFRVDHEVFELTKGIFARSHRRIRLDRLQSINLNRPLFVRLFGLTSFAIAGGGADGAILLNYIGRDEAERLRAEVLRRAAGAKQRPSQRGESSQAYSPGSSSQAGQQGHGAHAAPTVQHAPARSRTLGEHINGVLNDLTNFDDLSNNSPDLVRVQPVRMGLAQGLGTLFAMVVVLVLAAIAWGIGALILGDDVDDEFFTVMGIVLLVLAIILLIFMPLMVGIGSAMGVLNYTIAGTPDGIRISRGLANKVSETVPPGRIHSVQVSQPLLWRMGGWYRVQVNRIDAQFNPGADSSESAQQMMRTLPLPVGNIDDVQRLLSLLLPMNVNPQVFHLVAEGLKSGPRQGYRGVGRSAFWLHPFEWRRLGYAILPGVVLIRNGRLTRKLVLTPPERIQTVTAGDSPIERMLGLAHVNCVTVRGPAHSRIPGLPAEEAERLYLHLVDVAVDTAGRDTSHRWEEARAIMMLNAARIEVADASRQGRQPHPQAVQMLEAERHWQREQQPARQAESATGQPQNRRD